tara:strand:+ start:1204 stop:2091 length:888 start_codon:yes stop_codon:yes gene_type:complete
MKKISVIGAGTMGNGIAHCFAQKEFEVALIDLSVENLNYAKATINKNLDRMIKKDIIDVQQQESIMSRISFQTEFNQFVKNSDLVIEAVTESKQVKTKIFKELDELCDPKTILASNTSSISITDIANATNRQANIIGMHFMNPVPIMKLVEVIKTKLTSQETTNQIMHLSTVLDKKPVLVNDFPGFVANRILLPMINEAIQTLEDQVSGVIEIDTVMILGMSHPMGPLQLADFIGLDVCLSILEVLHEGLKHEKYKPNKLLVNMVKDGELGVKNKKGFYNYENGIKNKIVSERFS